MSISKIARKNFKSANRRICLHKSIIVGPPNAFCAKKTAQIRNERKILISDHCANIKVEETTNKLFLDIILETN